MQPSVEQEIVTHVADEPNGRTITWLCRFARSHGCDEPMIVLRKMERAGFLVLVDADGQPLPEWRCEEVWRIGNEESSVCIVARDAGVDWGYS